jgi:hypothetical protein
VQELVAAYNKQIAVIHIIMSRSIAYCTGVPIADPNAAAINAMISPLAPGTYGGGQVHCLSVIFFE